MMQYRLLRYNLIFTKNLINYVQDKFGKQNETQVAAELNKLLGKVYERERILRAHSINSKTQPSNLPSKSRADSLLMAKVKGLLQECIQELSCHFP